MGGEISAEESTAPTALLRGLLSQATSVVRRLPQAALNLTFPQVCAGCGDVFADALAEYDVPFCAPCLRDLELITVRTCPRCAMPLPITQEAPPASEEPAEPPTAWKRTAPGACFHCRGRRLWFQSAITAARYSGRMRELVLQMKRAEQNWLSLAMGQLVWNNCRKQLLAENINLVVPVPLHWRRRLTHGTNSAALVAEVLARRLRVRLASRMLKRGRNTQPQFSLTPPERRANVRGAFTVRAGYLIENAHVLLVDDIMTSGATANEAARSLRKAGAERVTVIVAARAVTQR